MTSAQDYCAVICSVPNESLAEQMAQSLVEKKLGACAQIWGPIKSFYRWESQLHSDKEYVLWVKTKLSRFAEVQDEILRLHPFKVPQIVSIPLGQGLPAYLDWIDNEVQKKEK